MEPTLQLPYEPAAGVLNVLGSHHWMKPEPGVFTFLLRYFVGPEQLGRETSNKMPAPLAPDGSLKPPRIGVMAFPLCQETTGAISQPPATASTTLFMSLPNCRPRPTGIA